MENAPPPPPPPTDNPNLLSPLSLSLSRTVREPTIQSEKKMLSLLLCVVLSNQKDAIRDGGGKVPSQHVSNAGTSSSSNVTTGGGGGYLSMVVLRDSMSLKVMRVVDLNLQHAITSFGISAGDRCIVLGLEDGSLTACGFHWGLDAFAGIGATQM
jgi:hypothetical protein